jgi:hypothetical protein
LAGGWPRQIFKSKGMALELSRVLQ